jgi:hypothetical protein
MYNTIYNEYKLIKEGEKWDLILKIEGIQEAKLN